MVRLNLDDDAADAVDKQGRADQVGSNGVDAAIEEVAPNGVADSLTMQRGRGIAKRWRARRSKLGLRWNSRFSCQGPCAPPRPLRGPPSLGIRARTGLD